MEILQEKMSALVYKRTEIDLIYESKLRLGAVKQAIF